MAMRYCGAITISLKYRDKGDYRCVVSGPRERPYVVRINPPASGFNPPCAYDSAQAYDVTAHAALSFAMDARCDFDSWVEFNKDADGFRITRTPRKVAS